MTRFHASTLLALSASFIASRPTAQDLYLMVGFGAQPTTPTSVPVTRAIDLDANGVIDAQTELFAFESKGFSVNNGNGAYITDMAVVPENGEPAFYWSDSGDGFVLRAVDANHNGVIEDSEVAIFARFGSGRTNSPEGMAVVRRGGKTIVYVALDNAQPGLWRCEDGNGNDNATDPGETALFVGTATALTVAGTSGPVTLRADDWKRVRVDSFGTVIAYHGGPTNATGPINPDDFCYYSFQDVNGVATNPKVFFNPSRLNGVPQNADVASSALPDLDIVTAVMPPFPFGDWIYHAIDQGVGPDTHYFANGYGPTRTFRSKNAAGEPLHGLVLRGGDQNFDGDLQDAGDVRIFHNGTGATLKGIAAPTFTNRANSSNTNDLADFITGIGALRGIVYFYYDNFGLDAVLKLDDQNRNGFTDTNEVTMPFFTPKPYPAVYNPTFGPFSIALQVLPEGLVPGPLASGLVPFGRGCAGSNGYSPVVDARGGAPAVGNPAFEVRAGRVGRGAPAIFLLGGSDTSFGGIPLPLDLSGAGMPGCFLRVSIAMLLVAVADGNGVATTGSLGIPNDASLMGAKVFAQWLCLDAAANAGGVTASNGLQVTIQ